MSPITEQTSVESTNPHSYKDIARIEIAFGERTIPKLVGETASCSDELRLQALHCLTYRLKDPIDLANVLHTPIVTNLGNSIGHTNPHIRAQAAEVTILLTVSESGFLQVINAGIINKILELVNDPDKNIRKYAYLVICNLTNTQYRASKFYKLHSQLLDSLVSNIEPQSRHDFSLLTILLTSIHQVLDYCGSTAVNCALDKDIVSILTRLLEKKIGGSDARIQALNCLSAIASHVCTQVNVFASIHRSQLIPYLVTLNDANLNVFAAALQTICTLSMHVNLKKEMANSGYVDMLVNVMDKESDPMVLLHALSAISSISEDSSARYTFQEMIPKLEQLMTHDNKSVAKAAENAHKVITRII